MANFIYKESLAYANEHDEIDIYLESKEANISCRDVLEQLVAENDYNGTLDSESVIEQAVFKFGVNRVKSVLANTVCFREDDVKIPNAYKEWAKIIPVPVEEERRVEMKLYFIQSVLLNQLITEIRKEYPEMAITDSISLRQACIDNGWFNDGSNTQYEKLFYANKRGYPIEQIALIIWLCTDREGLTQEKILHELMKLRYEHIERLKSENL